MTLRASMPITAAALDRLIFNLRAAACEILTKWAIRAAPRGYIPGMVLACVDAYRRDGDFAGLDATDAWSAMSRKGIARPPRKRGSGGAPLPMGSGISYPPTEGRGGGPLEGV